MLTKGVMQTVIRTFTEVLKLQNEEVERMDTLEKFDQTFGLSIPDWESKLIKSLQEYNDTDAAIKSIEAYTSKRQVYGARNVRR